jgi:hypothetical protein
LGPVAALYSTVLQAEMRNGLANKAIKDARRMQITGYCYAWNFHACQASVEGFLIP